MVIDYTLCLIRHEDRLLMLNRRSAPNQGLWNGVGGRIEPGESPLQAALREVAEETGLRLAHARYAGMVTWGNRYDQVEGGMYTFLAEVASLTPPGPLAVDEGILAWQPLDWVMDPLNQGVVSNLPRYLPVMLKDPVPYRHHCIYNGGRLRVCVRHRLNREWLIEA